MMKNLVIIGLVLISIQLLGAQESKRYQIKSGYIKLQITGNTEGVKEIWWDDYGYKTCELEKSTTTTKIFGMKSVEEKHMLTVFNNGQYWVRDYIDESGTTGKVPSYDASQEMVNSMSDEELKAFSESMLESMGGQKQGSEKVDGYLCEVYEIMGSKSWIYKGIAIKSEAKIMGISLNEKFVDFKPGISVSSSKFVAPKDIKYENLNAQTQNMWGAMGDAMGEAFEEEEEDEKVVPVSYPFDKFKKVVSGFSYDGYKSLGAHSMECVHAARFMKGMNVLMVVATSSENAEGEDIDSFESFNANGHKCYYGEMEDDEGTALLVEYPQHDMFISIVGIPDLPKQKLIDIASKLEF